MQDDNKTTQNPQYESPERSLNDDRALLSDMRSYDERRKISNGLIVSIVVLSLIVGGMSGFGASFYFYRSHQGASGDSSAAAQKQSKTTIVQEDSAIIDVVKRASPAVVSIVISKNVSQIQSDSNPFSNNPFFFDPFFNQGNSTPAPQSRGNSGSQSYREVGEGSGFFVTSDGLIITNKHVVSDAQAKYTVYTPDGKKYDAQVLAQDPNNDLALVKVSVKNAPTLAFSDSSKIEIGQRVIAIGNSLGQYRNTVTDGIVSGIGRNITAGGEGSSEQLEGVIQTNAAINPGNSGGPLLNVSGEVIGVNTAIDQQGQLLGFAIPSLDAKKDIQSFQKYGKIKKPFLGVRYVLITPVLEEQYKLPADNGAWVSSEPDQTSNSASIVPGGAADKAGLKDGDIITAVNGKAVDHDTTLAALIKQYNPDDTVNLDVLRGGKKISITVTLGEQ